MTSGLVNVSYIAATILFILALGGLSQHETSRRGNLYGIDHETGRADLTRGVLQGVGFAFRDCLGALQNAGTVVENLIAVGGGSQSKTWLKIIATILGLPIKVPASGDLGAAFGAARLGLAASSDVDPVAVCTAAEVVETIDPDSRHTAAYHDAWRQYRSFYPALKEAFLA